MSHTSQWLGLISQRGGGWGKKKAEKWIKQELKKNVASNRVF